MSAGLLHFQSWLEMPAVLSTEKMNKFLCLNSYDVLFESFWYNTNLEITEYNLNDGMFSLYFKTFLFSFALILTFCKNIMLNFDCSAISINAAWAVLLTTF